MEYSQGNSLIKRAFKKISKKSLSIDLKIFQSVTIWFPFSATILQEGGFYISICPEADIICTGKTAQEAIESLKKEVEKFLGEELPQGFSRIVYY